MKNILVFVFAMVAFVAITKAQNSELKFNQIKMVSTSETVPSGKVWKVEAALAGNGLHNGSSTIEVVKTITVNGNDVVIAGRSYATQSSDGNQSYGNYTKFPFWLPAGATLAAGSGVFEISVMEFNVVPE